MGFERDPLAALDTELGVASWPTPTVPTAAPSRPRPVGVPDWWDDDEEASQGFLAAMGVQLD